MSGQASRTLLALLSPIVLGCGPAVDIDGPSTSSSSGGMAESSGAPVSTGTTAVSSDGADGTTTTSTSTSTSTSTGTSDEPGGTAYEDDGVGTGCAFTCPNPPGGGGGGGVIFECDLDAQDCPPGEKCMPWANDGGMQWNATRCAPLADSTAAPGQACEVEGSQWSGIDDCEQGSMCWHVDPATNQGTCYSLCGLEPGIGPLCLEGVDCVPLSFVGGVCVAPCDPLGSSCGAGLRCLPFDSGFACLPDVAAGAGLGEPCDGSDACATGGLCAFDPAFSCGNAPGEGCCAAPCDVNAPGNCGGPGSQCVPWFPFRPPPELAHVGTCALP